MINIKIVFLYSIFYILYIFPYIISSTNFTSNEKIIEKRNVKRSIEEINNFKYDNEIIDNLSINNRKKRSIKIKMGKYRWTTLIDFYVYFPLNTYQIKKVLKIIETATCLRFKEAKSIHSCTSGFRFFASSFYDSHLGKQTANNWQKIEIVKEYFNEGKILRMILRALGVIYEHCRVDRNYYVKIFEENIPSFAKKYFQIYNKHEFTHGFIPYEYGSLMHFGMYNYSKNGGKTLISKDRLYENTIGQTDMLTFNDVRTLNLNFCSEVCKNPIICHNFGYQNPNNCNQCICIEGYGGVTCERYIKTKPHCTRSELLVTNTPLFWNITGRKHCIYHVRTSNFHKIKIILLKVRIDFSYPTTCSIGNTLEIKFLRDKALAGARFCHQKFPKFIKSQNNYVIIQYNSYNPKSYVHMYLKSSH
ncbi:Astacin-like metalloendopeptidase [Strongyloides ratti]|uniref:Metalloendopeptidase n=1 Tax=Strongyloides ratti TaxID=34506 RepID=A0A090LJF7_STRRB|nr:Astacin-like metalloendopeptidase [Strongyloides ratti]CEF68243.2 Astacin-like metalloendopeptidase [Strongyloides ratti]